MTRPPVLATRLLAAALARDDRAEILGDIEERFHEQIARTGSARAARWYWREAIVLSCGFLAIRVRSAFDGRMPRLALDDLRHAARRLQRHPAATAASVAALAFAIAASAAAWSLLSAVLINPLPVAAPDRLVAVEAGAVAPDIRFSSTHLYPTYRLVRESGVFDGLAAGGGWTQLAGPEPPGEMRLLYFASYDYFDTLGVRMQLGRAFSPDEDRRGQPLVAVLSDAFWRSSFDAAPDVLGREIVVGRERATVIGVAPARFRGLDLTAAPDVYLPLHGLQPVVPWASNPYFDRGDVRSLGSPTSWIRMVGRLPPGTTPDQVRDRLNALPLEGARPARFRLTSAITAAIPEAARTGMARFTGLLGVTVAFLLLIGCLTVGMLLLTRTEARRDEFAMCLALGATRWRLVRGVLNEGALLALASAVAALPLCRILFAGVRTFELPGRVSVELLDLSIDRSVVMAVTAAAVAATLLMALVAGAFGFSANVADAVRARMGATPRLGRHHIRRGLVVAQVAVALVLMAGAGLFARSLAEALRLNPGHRSDRLMTGDVNLTAYGYTPERATAFFDDLFARLGAHGAIAGVAQTAQAGGMSGGGRVIIDGQPTALGSFVAYVGVDHAYFRTMDLPVVRGRTFGPSDGPNAPPVIVVSESLARAIAPDGNAIGHHITDSSFRPPLGPTVREIVGVVSDVITDVRQLQPFVKYAPLAQSDEMGRRTIVLRAAASPEAAESAVRDVLHGLDAGVTPQPMRTIDEQLLDQMGPQRFGMLVMGALGTIAVLLTALGAFVTAELMAAARRREMGIRAALGASGGQLGRLIVRESARIVGIGLVVGLALAVAGAGMIRAFLFRVEPLDPITLAGVASGLLLLSVAVSLRPAFAASRPDLARLLKEE